jgi:hypothetical protein
MGSVTLVVDEWLWADLGANGSPKQAEAYRFLEAILAKCDRIAVVEGSEFARKSVAFWSHTDLRRRGIEIYYDRHFRYNNLKSDLKKQEELVELPGELKKQVKPADQYLVRAFITAKAQLIITTDNPLMDVLKEHGIACEHRDKFVPRYVRKYGPETKAPSR